MTDRVAVVTGGNRGIGRAIAVALAADGFAVAVTARDADTLADTVAAIEADGGTALAVPCDVRDEESVTTMARDVANLGRVHTVVANAGIAGPTAPLHEIQLVEWRNCLATDLDGVFLTFRAFVPAMIESGTGSLVAISSMTGNRPLHGLTSASGGAPTPPSCGGRSAPADARAAIRWSATTWPHYAAPPPPRPPAPPKPGKSQPGS